MNIVNKVTLKWLIMNKTRTIVTIIGVILSAAMITAVTTLISSAQNYAIKFTIAEEGDWHAVAYDVSSKGIEAISKRDDIKDAAVVKNSGYALLKGSINEYKPYLYIMELDDKAFKTLPVHLTEGRLPENEKEILISDHISGNGGVQYKIGDTLTLDVGDRVMGDGIVLGQKNTYAVSEDGEVLEKLVVKETRTFTVVGVCKRLSYRLENYFAPGYTILTKLNPQELTDDDDLDIYFKAKNPRKIYDIADSLQDIGENGLDYNSELLRFMGVSNIDNFNTVLLRLGAILIVLIMVGSIALIYNSFSISVSERKKQFGLLSGAGATSRQIKHSVFFEALAIAVIGIPLGVMSGILGIGVTLYFMGDLFASMITTNIPVSLTLSVSPLSIVVAALVALITILISAYIPARRAARVSAMDAIRQTTEIKLTGKQVKTSRLTRKIFKIEGDLGMKNMKRNRRRYRSTVISLFISVVLFVSVSAFSMYLRDSVMNVYENQKYDLLYSIDSKSLKDSTISAFNDILSLDSVKEGALVRYTYCDVKVQKEQVQGAWYEEKVSQGHISEGQDALVHVDLYSVDHDTFTDYVRELGLEESLFENPASPAGILVDKQHFFDQNMQKYRNTSIFDEHKPETLSLSVGYGDSDGEGNRRRTDIAIAAVADKAPFGIQDYAYKDTVLIIIDTGVEKSLFADIEPEWNGYMCFSSDKPFKAEEDMKKILSDAGLSSTDIYNVAEMLQDNRNLITILSVFSYGFIILISLITIANVFNTISTNVNLRRREFAMLKSVGMTDRSFRRMMNFECIFYGLKALIYGLPVSIFLTYLIYQSVNEGVDMAFYLPTQGILISIACVFLVVFSSMIYSMRKIGRENILDALKNENL